MNTRAVTLLLVACVALSVIADGQRLPLFMEEISEDPERFHRDVTSVWTNLFGQETMQQLDNYAKENFLLFNNTAVMIPMSDGVELYTILSFPFGYNGEPLPAVMDRTPYNAEDNVVTLGAAFHHKGYVIVSQDMRGRYKSGGVWDYWRNSAKDGFDTVQWITEQSWSNGQVFGIGVSADGIAAGCMEVHIPPPPGLKALSLIVATSDAHETTYNGGAYRQNMINEWLQGLDEGWIIPVVQDHEAYSSWWWPIDMTHRWNNSNVPALHMGGWYDVFAGGTVDAFLNMQYNGGEGAKGNQLLIMNALGHCRGGQYEFPGNTNAWPLEVTWNLFEQAQSDLPYQTQSLPVCLYVMGPDPTTMTETDSGNFWSCMDAFPEAKTQSYYLHEGGQLHPNAVDHGNEKVQSFEFDPSNPVPTIGGANLILDTCGPYDQSSLESRDDVLVFTTPPLEEAVAITGNVSVTLFVSSSANDTDFTAKLTDVYDGKSYNILDNIIRMRWRDSRRHVTLMEPGEVYEVTINLMWVSYVFNVNHQIRLDISSSNYPRFSANLNNGNTLIQRGTPVVAKNSIHYSYDEPSRLNLPVVSLQELEQASRTPFPSSN